MPSPKRLQLRSATVNNLASVIEEKLTRKVRLDIADTNSKSPLKSRIDKVVENRHDKVARMMSAYYSGHLKAVGSILNAPPKPAAVRPPGGGGFPVKEFTSLRKTISVGVASGVNNAPSMEQVVLESESPWKGLSAKYAASQGRWVGLPKSRTFWRKTGLLAELYTAWYASVLGTLSNPERYKVTGPAKIRTKGTVTTYIFNMQHPKLGHPALDALLRGSYITGRPQRYTSGKVLETATVRYGRSGGMVRKNLLVVDDQTLNRITLPEANRPMLARFSASMGRREITALRKMLKR